MVLGVQASSACENVRAALDVSLAGVGGAEDWFGRVIGHLLHWAIVALSGFLALGAQASINVASTSPGGDRSGVSAGGDSRGGGVERNIGLSSSLCDPNNLQSRERTDLRKQGPSTEAGSHKLNSGDSIGSNNDGHQPRSAGGLLQTSACDGWEFGCGEGLEAFCAQLTGDGETAPVVARGSADGLNHSFHSGLVGWVLALVFTLLDGQPSSVWCVWWDGEFVVERIERGGWGCCGDVQAGGSDVDGTKNGVGAGIGVPLLETHRGAGLGIVQLEGRFSWQVGTNGGSAKEADGDVFDLVDLVCSAAQLKADQRRRALEEVGIHDVASATLTSTTDTSLGWVLGRSNWVDDRSSSIADQNSLRASIELSEWGSRPGDASDCIGLLGGNSNSVDRGIERGPLARGHGAGSCIDGEGSGETSFFLLNSSVAVQTS